MVSDGYVARLERSMTRKMARTTRGKASKETVEVKASGMKLRSMRARER